MTAGRQPCIWVTAEDGEMPAGFPKVSFILYVSPLAGNAAVKTDKSGTNSVGGKHAANSSLVSSQLAPFLLSERAGHVSSIPSSPAPLSSWARAAARAPSRHSHHRVLVVVRSSQHRVVDGGGRAVGALRRAVDVLLPLAAEDLPEGGAHLLVPVGVDDGVHGRIELRQEQEELLEAQDVALAAEDI